jgi:iron-regulated transporter 1
LVGGMDFPDDDAAMHNFSIDHDGSDNNSDELLREKKLSLGTDSSESLSMVDLELADFPEVRPGDALDLPWKGAFYGSHALSAWGDRMWEYANVIFVLEVFPDTLFAVSAVALTYALSSMVFGARMGKMVDVSPRLWLARLSLLIQNGSVAGSALLLLVLVMTMTLDEDGDSDGAAVWGEWWKRLLFLSSIAFGCLAGLASTALTIAVEKDWLVVACKPYAHPTLGVNHVLTDVNAVMRRIDLLAKILAPILVGLLSYISVEFSIVFVAVWNCVSLPVEYILLKKVYDAIPQLAESKSPATTPSPASSSLPESTDTNTVSSWQSCQRYFQHPVLLASMSYVLLYGSVLSFGNVMIAFVLWSEQMSEAGLAAARGCGALLGLAATVLAPKQLARGWGLDKTAYFYSVALLFAISVACASFLFSDVASGGSVAMLVLGVVLSRFGLWGFDLVMVQILQERVDPAEAGRISGVQSSLLNVMYVAGFIFTLIVPDPSDFYVAGWFSFSCLLASTITFTCYRVQRNENIAHSMHKDFAAVPSASVAEENALINDCDA